MTKVYLLWHIHGVSDGEDNEKLIGVYATEADATEAVGRLREKPGFKDFPGGFQIAPCAINRDGWSEGFISASDALSQQ